MDVAREATQVDVDRSRARSWLLIAALSLMLAGALALLLVVARTPGMDRVVGDPLFFKRVLVVHVDLSMTVWFCAFIAGLFSLLPRPGAGAGGGVDRGVGGAVRRAAPAAALGAVLVLVAVGLVPGVRPVLSNYVPMLEHPLFAAGLLLFALAVAAAVADVRRLRGGAGGTGGAGQEGALLPAEAGWSLRAAALMLLVALLTFAEAWVLTPAALSADTYYEVLYWGGGHVLQFANASAMVACWVALLTPVLGRSPLTARQAALVAGLMLLPVLSAPVLGWQDTTGGEYRVAFTRLMQWGIFPGVLVALGLSARALWAARGATAPQARWQRNAFWASATLTVLGFVLGALIRGSTTTVPAHYHAAIGGVTAAFMAVAFGLLAPLGMPVPEGRWWAVARLQPVLYGVGQSVFALGMAVAGSRGMERKAYGAEQVRRSLAHTLGMAVSGLGGLVAVVSGALFVVVVLVAWRAARARAAAAVLAAPSDGPPLREAVLPEP
jgi:hypothetical protein